MLSLLRIQNLALVEDLSVPLEDGFTVLTGETGAGKSLLVDALSPLVGGRGDGGLVRSGAERAVVEGVVEGAFEGWSAFLEGKGLPLEQPVVLRREVGAQGRSRAWINGAPCNLGDLKEAGRLWMRLTSQHDHQSLLSEERHLALLDEALGLRPDLSALAEAVREAEAALKARRRSESERESRLEWLAEQLQDFDKLAPKPGEWAQLRAEREPLRHAAQLDQAFREGAEGFHEGVPSLQRAHRALLKTSAVLPEFQPHLDRLRSALLELEDLEILTQEQALHWSKAGTERIEAVEARLAMYEKLARRHHCEPEELADQARLLREEQRNLLAGDSSLQELERQLARAVEAYRQAAEALHERRAAWIPKLEKEIHARLQTLGMKGARLQARLSLALEPASPVVHAGQNVKVSSIGFSALALWIEPNPGEGFRPLAKIASGGELSRVMLAFLGAGMALSEDKKSPNEMHEGGLTLVLDEVDAGIGGETALAVGDAVRGLGGRHQVLAVTHLAQVAAKATHHGQLSKGTSKGRTRSELAWLQNDERIRELARLLSGHPDGAEAQSHARSLLGSS
ncbi:MAG: DNA repair protein RecN [Firmicutes bacterium]|nr:DNA repair protein RecN [Bacillota bacterium]